MPFNRAVELDWNTAVIIEDTRYNYPEKRFVATGYLGNRVHILCFAPVSDGMRVISFRKANKREVKIYEF